MKRQFAVCVGFLWIAGFAFIAASGFAAESPQIVPGGGLFGEESANVICDALVLDKAQSEKVAAAYEKTNAEILPKMEEQRKTLSGLSKEDQTKKMQEIDGQYNSALQANLKGVLTDKELETVKPILEATQKKHPESKQVTAELRSLRAVDLKPEQRTALQPIALELLSSTIHEPNSEKSNPQKAAEYASSVEKAQKSFMEKTNAILSDAQKTEWKAKETAIREEMKTKAEQKGLKSERLGAKEEKSSSKEKKEKIRKVKTSAKEKVPAQPKKEKGK